jgi:uncharacterized protein YyaL (SSP411 family)
MSESNPKENHLRGQVSPYLLQHLYNPVDWYPWCEEALRKAKSESKPLLVSIGYSACHWCHVMEKESFENNDLATLMNKYFICIKVDREERPDIDHLYMNAVQMLSGRGGWPLNCFALPDGRPFWGGTYFPPDQWKNVLIRIHELYKNQYSDLEEQANQLTKGVEQASLIALSNDQPVRFDSKIIHSMASSLIQNTDLEEGGTLGAPKFPLPGIYEFLLHYHAQNPQKTEALDAVNITLQKMAMGGIDDQIGGGFARYSVDEIWKVPHFEKMLYDNAQLISLYSKAWKVNQNSLYKQVVQDTIGFVKRELTSPYGTFYAALDADSEGVEGKFYVWDEKEIREVLDDDASLAIEYFHVGGKGFWEHNNNILLTTRSVSQFAEQKGLDEELMSKKIDQWKSLLLNQRESRVRPGLDNKVLVSWNGFMIVALIDAAVTFQNPDWLSDAEKATHFLLKQGLEADNRLYHTLQEEKGFIDGFLEDYASMINALIRLGEATGKETYFLKAADLLEYVLAHFISVQTSMFPFSPDTSQKLVATHYEFQDNVIPSSNSIMARNLFYLGNLFEKSEWIDRSRHMLSDMSALIEKSGSWASNWGILWLHHQKDFYTLAVSGPKSQEKAAQLLQRYLPDTMVCTLLQPKTRMPLLKNRWSEKETFIYPCTLTECLSPVSDPSEVKN